MAYLEPTDTQTLRRIGINMGALIVLTFVLIGIVSVVL